MKAKNDFLKLLAETLKTVEDFGEPKDRLSSVSQILQARNASVFSSNNWMVWLGNPVFLDTLTDAQIEKIRVFWNEVAAKMLRFDYEITKEVDFSKSEIVKGGRIGLEPV